MVNRMDERKIIKRQPIIRALVTFDTQMWWYKLNEWTKWSGWWGNTGPTGSETRLKSRENLMSAGVQVLEQDSYVTDSTYSAKGDSALSDPDWFTSLLSSLLPIPLSTSRRRLLKSKTDREREPCVLLSISSLHHITHAITMCVWRQPPYLFSLSLLSILFSLSPLSYSLIDQTSHTRTPCLHTWTSMPTPLTYSCIMNFH